MKLAIIAAALALSGCVNISGNTFATCAPSAVDALLGPAHPAEQRRAPKGLRIIPAAPKCSTDSECEAQCREDLRPDEDPSVCNI